MLLDGHWIRRGVVIVVGFRLCTLDGVVPRGGNTRPIQRRLGLLDHQHDCHVGVVSIKAQTRVGNGNEYFRDRLLLGVNPYLLQKPTALYARFAYAIVGILLFGIGTAFYLTCHQGPGPRDGLMVGLCQHFHWKIGIVRTSIEVLVCVFGFLLGGVLGIGTLMFAFGIGWVVQYTLFFINRIPHFRDKVNNFI